MPAVPAVAAVGASIGSAAAAAGSAIAAGVSAVGGLSGLMSGVAIVGGAMQAVGAITGSKALTNIGGIASMIGGVGSGVGMLSKGLSGAAASARSGGSIAKQSTATGLGTFGPMANTEAGKVGLLNSAGQFGGSKVPTPTIQTGTTAANFGGAASPMGGINNQTGETLPFDERLRDLMARYDSTSMWGMQALAGASDAYMMYEMTKLNQEPAMARLRFDQQQANMSRQNMASVPSLAPAVNSGGFLDQGFVSR